jgi:hypothetical protein
LQGTFKHQKEAEISWIVVLLEMIIAQARIGPKRYHWNCLGMRILNMSLKFFYSICERKAKQNVWRDHFLQLGGGGRECCGTNLPKEVVGMAAFYQF